VIIDQPPTEASDEVLARAHERLATLPCVLVGTAPSTLVDLVVTVDDLAEVEATFALAPTAGSALALHLRAADRRPPLDALVAESALFSALQAGPEHGAWRAGHQRRDRQDMHPPVRAERDGTQLRITLDRPNVRNAVSSSMRDVLLAALAVAEAVPELEVHLHGAGPDFCAGGDLDEFGTTPDPATAHLIRTRRSLAAVLHRLAPRTTAHLHGGALGAGIELAAFAGRVLADPETRIGLPELGLGLIPGAGGTVSLPLRIGRQRTAWLALTRRTIDAPTALAWGLVDEIVPVGPSRAG
jgi:enoyl-CoA hydratase/carnithine racemase